MHLGPVASVLEKQDIRIFLGDHNAAVRMINYPFTVIKQKLNGIGKWRKELMEKICDHGKIENH